MKKNWIMQSLLFAFKSSPFLFALNTIFFFFNGILSTIQIWAVSFCVNAIQNANANIEIAFFWLFVYGIVNLIFRYFQIGQGVIYGRMNLKFSNYLDEKFFEKTLEYSALDYETESHFELLVRADNQGKEKVESTYNHILILFQSAIRMTSAWILLIKFGGDFLFLVFLVPFLQALIQYKMGKYIYTKERETIPLYRKSDYLQSIVGDNRNYKEVIGFHFGDYLLSRFKTLKSQILQLKFSYDKKRFISQIILETLDIIIMLFMLFRYLRTNFKIIGRIGDFVGFIYALDSCKESTEAFLQSIAGLEEDKLYVKDFFLFYHGGDKNKSSGTFPKINEISLKNVSFSYPKRGEVLTEISIEIKKGKPIVMLGENGSGKTTLLKLIAGLYMNYSGDFYVNGECIKKENFSDYRERVSAVYQDFSCYEMSIEENICVSDLRRENREEELEKLLNFEWSSFLKESEKSDILGNLFGGRELSGGEWQRIALLRAFYRDADIYLFDEATSKLDYETEEKVLGDIFKIAKDHIVIMITHNLEKILKYNPMILIIESGKIAFYGETEDFLSSKGGVKNGENCDCG